MVILRSSSFLNFTVRTPEIAFTSVDFPWAKHIKVGLIPTTSKNCKQTYMTDRSYIYCCLTADNLYCCDNLNCCKYTSVVKTSEILTF